MPKGKVSDKSLMEMAQVLKEHCEDNGDDCTGCLFNGKMDCSLKLPYEWSV